MNSNGALLFPVILVCLSMSQTQVPERKLHVVTGLENLLNNRWELVSGKNIGIVTNQTGVDRQGTPIWERIDAVALFSPEHGLFGEVSDGEAVSYEYPLERGPRVFSLYGKTRKPAPETLENLDLLIYDIQDIGTRCYTFITTMGLVMEAAGEAGIPVLILDRPNPLTGTRIEGPSLKAEFQSFVGYYAIPLQYGLTPGELARMIVGEGWISHRPSLDVVPLVSWKRDLWYDETDLPWVLPSPNIPNLTTAIVYPGMVFVEATNVSEGRGTDHPFLRIGAPWIDGKHFSGEMNNLNLPGVAFKPSEFTPRHLPGVASHPKYEGIKCHGIEIQLTDRDSFQSVKTGIGVLVVLNRLYPDQFKIRTDGMNRLAGSDLIVKGLENDWSLSNIVSFYGREVQEFRKLRQKYILY